MKYLISWIDAVELKFPFVAKMTLKNPHNNATIAKSPVKANNKR